MQRAVLCGLQQLQNIAFPTLLRELATAGKGLVFGILEFFFQLVYLDEILLTAIAVGDIDDTEESNQQQKPNLSSDSTRVEYVATEDFVEGEIRCKRALFFCGLLFDNLL